MERLAPTDPAASSSVTDGTARWLLVMRIPKRLGISPSTRAGLDGWQECEGYLGDHTDILYPDTGTITDF
jgi:hypothetical protein